MTITELKDQIMKHNLSNFYIFTGLEIGIMNIYLQQMSNTLKLPLSRADSVASVYGRCQGGSLFGDEIGFYVIRNDTDFPKNEMAYQTIKKSIGKNVIVLLYDKIDSRLKFGKYFKDEIVAFEKLTPTVLKSYIRKAAPFTDYTTELLADVCNGSYDLAMLEIDKVKQYANSEGITVDKAFDILLKSGVIYQPEETDIWKFTDAVCSHKVNLAFHILQVLKDNGNSSVSILGTLYSSLKNIMLIQCCEGSNVSEVTGLDNKQIYFNKKYVNKYSTEALVHALKLINKVVSGIKSGWIDDMYATEYILVNIL